MQNNFIRLLTFTFLAVTPRLQAGEAARWPHGPDELQVRLHVIHALEEGPVVCKVILKNVSKATLKYAWDWRGDGSTCTVDGLWKAQAKPAFFRGSFFSVASSGPRIGTLRPDEEAGSHLFHLHSDYGTIPAGKATIHCGWIIYRISDNQELKKLFALKKSQSIDIQAASKANVSATLQSLENELGKLARSFQGDRAHLVAIGDDRWSFAQTAIGCRHPEFVPLLLRATDILPDNFNNKMIATIYDSFTTPAEGFEVMLSRLADPNPADARELFAYWIGEDQTHAWIKLQREDAKKKLDAIGNHANAERPLSNFLEEIVLGGEEASKSSRRHLDTRLTAEQFVKLRALPNVWIRALLYAHYPQHCPDAWVKTLLYDLRRTVEPPARFPELLARLDSDQFRVRDQATAELLTFGPSWTPAFETMAKTTESAEVARRLQQILEKLGEQPSLPRVCERTIAHLSWDPAPQNQRMLDALASSKYPNLISQAARQGLAEHKRRDAKIRAGVKGSRS